MDKFRLDGKKGFVTGAAQGIGRAIAEAFVQAGAELAIIDVNADKARAAAAELSARYDRHYRQFRELYPALKGVFSAMNG